MAICNFDIKNIQIIIKENLININEVTYENTDVRMQKRQVIAELTIMTNVKYKINIILEDVSFNGYNFTWNNMYLEAMCNIIEILVHVVITSSIVFSSNFSDCNLERIIRLSTNKKNAKNDPVIARFNRQSVTARVIEKVPGEEAAVKHIFLHTSQIMK